ncbi:MAG: insulinase family protein [Gemmatimonadetes bacterium]|nr:insulinase family protein [Gemmatimonadota bacterium]
MFRRTLLAFAPVALALQPAVAQLPTLDTPLPVDSAVMTGVLENGLRYYIRANTRPEQRAELRLVVNAGSVLEDDDQLGLAHFVEHMAFNGTEHYPKQELVEYLERIGMRFGPDINATTSFDETVYMLTVPTDTIEVFDEAFQILEDWAHLVSFDYEEIDRERGVVIEEWRLGRGADARMRDQQFPVLFRDSRYAVRLPIGDPDLLENFPYDAVKRFYRDWYRPGLMAVIAVGDFDPAHVENLIRAHFAHIPPVEAPRPRTVFDVPGHSETLVTVATDAEATHSAVSVYYKQPLREAGTVGAYRQGIVEGLYNGMLNNRFFEITQSPDAPFLGASSGQGRLVRSGEVYFLGAAVQEGGIVKGLDGLLTEVERVSRFGFTASELERVKANLLRGMELAFAERDKTDSGVYASEYVRAFLEGEAIPGIAYEYELYQAFMPNIILDEIDRLAGEWLVDENRVVTVNAPDKEGVPVPSAVALLVVFEDVAQLEIAPYEDGVTDAPLVAEAPLPSLVVSEERVDKVGVIVWELANGVRVLLKPTDFQADQVLFRATSPGGHSLVEDDEYVAAATATSVVGRGGVGQFSLVDLQKALAGKAVSVQPTISATAEGMSGGASPQDLETMFQLVYLHFTAPRRDETAFRAFLQRVRANVENRDADPILVFQDTVAVTMAQHHFRARPFTLEILDEMNLETSMAVYKDRFEDASDFTFAFVGNFDVDSIRPLVETYLGGLPSTGRVETWRDVGIDPPSGVVRRTVRRGVEPQSQTAIIFTGDLAYTRENRHVLNSMAAVLQTWLRETLREDLGGTYGVSVNASATRIPRERYQISIGFGSAPDRAEELAAAVFHHIDSLKTTGPSADDVAKIRESQRRARETSLKENAYWLTQLIGFDRDERDLREILLFESMIDALDPATIQRAAQQFFNTDNYVHAVLLPEEAARWP